MPLSTRYSLMPQSDLLIVRLFNGKINLPLKKCTQHIPHQISIYMYITMYVCMYIHSKFICILAKYKHCLVNFPNCVTAEVID